MDVDLGTGLSLSAAPVVYDCTILHLVTSLHQSWALSDRQGSNLSKPTGSRSAWTRAILEMY